MSKSFLVLLNPFFVQVVSDFLTDRQEFLDSHHDYDGLFGFAASKSKTGTPQPDRLEVNQVVNLWKHPQGYTPG